MKLFYVMDDLYKLDALKRGLRYREPPNGPRGVLLYDRAGLDRFLQYARRWDWLDEVCVLVVSVPEKWCERMDKGVWLCLRDVPPENIKGELFIDSCQDVGDDTCDSIT